MSDIQVVKRDGSKEPLDIDKFHKVVMWACEDINGVSASEVEIRSHVSFYDGIRSDEIQETLIKAAADLISEETPNYQYVAGRLINYHLRKQVYGQYEPPRLLDHVKNVIDEGFYDPEILDYFTEEEWAILDEKIDHSRDDALSNLAKEVAAQVQFPESSVYLHGLGCVAAGGPCCSCCSGACVGSCRGGAAGYPGIHRSSGCCCTGCRPGSCCCAGCCTLCGPAAGSRPDCCSPGGGPGCRGAGACRGGRHH